MVDSGVQGSEAVEAYEVVIKQHEPLIQQKKKTCAECGKSKTPLWRTSPDRIKTLCNACGIKSRKKDPSLTKENNNHKKKRKRRIKETSLKQRIRNLVSQVLPQRSRVDRRWRKLGEVERAAVLLMSFTT